MATEDNIPGNGSAEEEPEVVEEPTLDDKLDRIIDLLKKNEEEHREIKGRLEKIETNQDLLREAYQTHGVRLGEMAARLDELWRRL